MSAPARREPTPTNTAPGDERASAKRALVTIAAALARTADYGTGRDARPTNERLTKATGFTERTVQRARECLQLLGVATEVLRGRQRTYIERMTILARATRPAHTSGPEATPAPAGVLAQARTPDAA